MPGHDGQVRLNCPASQGYTEQFAQGLNQQLTKACREGYLNISYLREHLKSKHVCDAKCFPPCTIPTHHITPEQFNAISKITAEKSLPRVRKWYFIYRIIHPNSTSIPKPFNPSVEYLSYLANSPHHGFIEHLDGVSANGYSVYAKLFPAVIEYTSLRGTVRDIDEAATLENASAGSESAPSHLSPELPHPATPAFPRCNDVAGDLQMQLDPGTTPSPQPIGVNDENSEIPLDLSQFTPDERIFFMEELAESCMLSNTLRS